MGWTKAAPPAALGQLASCSCLLPLDHSCLAIEVLSSSSQAKTWTEHEDSINLCRVQFRVPGDRIDIVCGNE